MLSNGANYFVKIFQTVPVEKMKFNLYFHKIKVEMKQHIYISEEKNVGLLIVLNGHIDSEL